ncbi:hypothetical protein FA15DRAFT_742816 [Coprinopsis marcescibilis]|uniref:Nephrocystin 3-like N-terminal domain-containing protein n=1 Tax=Coprinopsis marcescibilis TaxID=230819 RepID=A0A5C3KUL7_COPMA|nr:hypothetical protein FA15DRAFT_742816 [Coprinopsis marcescibilis]
MPLRDQEKGASLYIQLGNAAALPKDQTRQVDPWPVGMGKTAIAQTLGEMYEEENISAASLFFDRGDPERNRVAKLVPSLALQLAYSFHDLRPHIENAIYALPANNMVDGLDKCLGPVEGRHEHEQLLVLELLEMLLSSNVPPIILLSERTWKPSIYMLTPTWITTLNFSEDACGLVDIILDWFWICPIDLLRLPSGIGIGYLRCRAFLGAEAEYLNDGGADVRITENSETRAAAS